MPRGMDLCHSIKFPPCVCWLLSALYCVHVYYSVQSTFLNLVCDTGLYRLAMQRGSDITVYGPGPSIVQHLNNLKSDHILNYC